MVKEKVNRKSLSDDLSYLKKLIEKDQSFVLNNIALFKTENLVLLQEALFLSHYRRSVKGKPFYRNFQRVLSNSLPKEEMKKIVSSALTHLFIEFDKLAEVKSLFSRFNNILKLVCEDSNYDYAVKELSYILGIGVKNG